MYLLQFIIDTFYTDINTIVNVHVAPRASAARKAVNHGTRQNAERDGSARRWQ